MRGLEVYWSRALNLVCEDCVPLDPLQYSMFNIECKQSHSNLEERSCNSQKIVQIHPCTSTFLMCSHHGFVTVSRPNFKVSNSVVFLTSDAYLHSTTPNLITQNFASSQKWSYGDYKRVMQWDRPANEGLMARASHNNCQPLDIVVSPSIIECWWIRGLAFNSGWNFIVFQLGRIQ